MIVSLLDNDLYKFTMMQVVYHHFQLYDVQYKFICRDNTIRFPYELVSNIKSKIDKYCSLTFTEDELKYLESIRFIKKDFVDFLRLYKPNRKYIKIIHNENNFLDIEIKGSWLQTILFEVPILSIISEEYNKYYYNNDVPYYDDAITKLKHKLEIVYDNNLFFSDFGTRRRFSFNMQDDIIYNICDNYNIQQHNFLGTSNVYFAKKYNIKLIGTMAHEFLMAGQGNINIPIINSQSYMLQKWVDEYRGDLGIALTDTLGLNKFLKDFDMYFAKLYDGVRHDSGDPILWGYAMLKHYDKLNIPTQNKTFVFSDGLNFEMASKIKKEFKDKIRVTFGIGTNLTNDCGGYPLPIVIKMVMCNNKPIAKLSDNPDKTTCVDNDYLEYLKRVVN
jgi:nicotinate phosphoribosyltransferase